MAASGLQASLHLLVRSGGARFGLAAESVREVVGLPALEPLPGTGAGIRGALLLRGDTVPVFDPAGLFGREQLPLQPEACVVVLADGCDRVGVLFDAAEETSSLPPGEPAAENEWPVTARLQTRQGLVSLLEPGRLVEAAAAALRAPPGGLGAAVAGGEWAQWLLRRRAERLRMPSEGDAEAERPLLGVVRLGGEPFGIPLRSVGEFIRLGPIRPLPVTPEHIAGFIALRGELVTVVEIHRLLAVAPGRTRRAVVVRHPRQGLVAVPVEAVEQVVALPEGPPPVTLPYRDTALELLDLERLLDRPELIVDQPEYPMGGPGAARDREGGGHGR